MFVLLRCMPRSFRRSRLTSGRRRLLDRLLDELIELEPGVRDERLVELEQRVPRLTRWLRDLLAADTDAEQLAAEAVASGRKELTADHWHLGVFLAGYGLVLADQSRFVEAESALLEAYELYENGLGSEHPRTLSLVPNLVSLYERWHSQAPDGGHQPRAAAWRDLEKDHQP